MVAIVALEGIIVELLRGQDLEAAYLLGFKSQPNILLARWPWASHSTFLFLSFFFLSLKWGKFADLIELS